MNPSYMRAGAGCAVIVFPEEYFPWEGYRGIHDDIHARALLLEQEERLAIISLELPSVRPYELIDPLRVMVSQLCSVPFENVWLCMTHDLVAPHVPPIETLPEKHHMHVQAIERAIQEACQQALATMTQVRVGTAKGTCDVNTNRDIPSNDGWWLGIDGVGPVDSALTLTRFEDINGKPVAFLYHYAVKSSTMENTYASDGTRLITAELTGTACRYIEDALGAPTIFFMGAAGDLVPKQKANYAITNADGDLQEIDHGENGFEFVRVLGERLGQELLHLNETLTGKCRIPIMTVVHDVWMLPGQKGYHGGRPYRPMKTYDYIPSAPEALNVELLRLDEAVWLGLQPEATAKIGLTLAEHAPFRHTMMVAMVNGGKDYLADTASYDRFTFSGTHSVFARGSAEQFVARAVEMLNKLKQDDKE